MITLKQICTELKLDPREARERLRSADAKKYPDLVKDRKPRTLTTPHLFLFLI